MRGFDLAGVSVYPQRGVIRSGQEDRHLKPRVMKVLSELCEQPGELHTKSDLISAVWGHANIGDEVLTQAIYEIRLALKGSEAEGVVRTIPRQGYILDARVRSLQSTPVREHSLRKMVHSGYIIALLVVAGLWFLPGEQPLTDQPVTSQESDSLAQLMAGDNGELQPSLAILPFENLSSDPDSIYFTDGLHDDLLTKLANLSGLKVISRTSVMAYRGTDKRIPEIARELGVSTILEGSVRQTVDHIRVNVQLIDARTDGHIWSETLDSKLDIANIFQIQSELSKQIATQMNLALSHRESEQLDRIPTSSRVAFQVYIEGKRLLLSRLTADLQQALELFREATEADPQFAEAWVGIATSVELLSGYGTLKREVSIPIMEAAIERALQLDPGLGEAYATRALIHQYKREWTQAEADYQKAIDQSPNYSTAYHWYSIFLARHYKSRIGDAVALARKAYALDPNSPMIAYNLSIHYRAQGLYSMAEQILLQINQQWPNFAKAYSGLGRLYLVETGQFDKALRYMQLAAGLDPGNPHSLLNLFEIQQQLGDIEGMRSSLAELKELLPFDSPQMQFARARLAFQLGDTDTAWYQMDSLSKQMPGSEPVAEYASYLDLLKSRPALAKNRFLALDADWDDPATWFRKIEKNPRGACLYAVVLQSSGSAASAEKLAKETLAFFETELSRSIEHPDRWSPEICQLVLGKLVPALESMVTQFEHGHLYRRDLDYRLPIYAALLESPVFAYLKNQRQSLVDRQRHSSRKNLAAVGEP